VSHSLENHKAPLITFQVWYRVGSHNEEWGKAGISYMLEHRASLKVSEIVPQSTTQNGVGRSPAAKAAHQATPSTAAACTILSVVNSTPTRVPLLQTLVLLIIKVQCYLVQNTVLTLFSGSIFLYLIVCGEQINVLSK